MTLPLPGPSSDDRPLRIVVGVSGATGTVLAVRVLDMLGDANVERHLVVSPSARRTATYELPKVRLEDHAEVRHSWRDIGAPIASGSFPFDGMIVVPCSVKTLSGIAFGFADNLLTRAADVALKERRRLVLSVRETPLHLGHIRAMAAVTEFGGIIAPPMPAFYARPTSLDDVIEHMSARLVSLLGVEVVGRVVWAGDRHVAAEDEASGLAGQ